MGSDPIFALFVILMVLLFFLLLLKRLYRKPSPMELQFESLSPPRQTNVSSVPTISVAVHHHDNHHPNSNNNSRNNPSHQLDMTTPPPSFEDVVSQKPPQQHQQSIPVQPGQDNGSFIDDQPPPSYQEYLRLQKEGYREEQGKF